MTGALVGPDRFRRSRSATSGRWVLFPHLEGRDAIRRSPRERQDSHADECAAHIGKVMYRKVCHEMRRDRLMRHRGWAEPRSAALML